MSDCDRDFHHLPVLLSECMEGLGIKPDGVYIDATAGGAGHSVPIAERLTTGKLFALDQDPDAVKAASERLKPYPNAQVIQTNFSQMAQAVSEPVDGILMDLGVSSFQLDTPERGFSYQHDGPLDMRMSKSGRSAGELINTASVQELTRILQVYGEERFAFAIAKGIEKARADKPVETTFELCGIVTAAVPAKVRRAKNPCKKTFQAIRIAVNGELDVLESGLGQAFGLLKPGGRLAVITFHSLEDRLVKQMFAGWCKGCVCPPDFPVCVCENNPQASLVYKKAVTASDSELEKNHRSHSAKLRVIQKEYE